MYFAACAFDLRQPIDSIAQLRTQQVYVDASLRQQATNTLPPCWSSNATMTMRRLDELVVLADSKRLRIGERHLEFGWSVCPFA